MTWAARSSGRTQASAPLPAKWNGERTYPMIAAFVIPISRLLSLNPYASITIIKLTPMTMGPSGNRTLANGNAEAREAAPNGPRNRLRLQTQNADRYV